MCDLASACFPVAGIVFLMFLRGNIMDVSHNALRDLPAISPSEMTVHERNRLTIKGVSDFLGGHLVVRVLINGLHNIE